MVTPTFHREDARGPSGSRLQRQGGVGGVRMCFMSERTVDGGLPVSRRERKNGDSGCVLSRGPCGVSRGGEAGEDTEGVGRN